METIAIRNARIINEGLDFEGNVLLKQGRIWQISSLQKLPVADRVIDLKGDLLLPGLIDDQVHFREPGLTHKADIRSESLAAVAGGVTTYMEMPNTVPGATTVELLEQKYSRAAEVSAANYSFFMGTTNDNLDEIRKVDFSRVCGLKIFMGSSTGNMLVDDSHTLSRIFAEVPAIIAVHCEDDKMIAANLERYKAEYGEDLPTRFHALIRDADACFASSSKAKALAEKHNSRLHILHISTAKETELFSNALPLEQKRITAEACIHHLWFSDEDYDRLGNFIKWNPAVKTSQDREAVWQALLDGRIDVVATDHAPHTLEEKQKPMLQAPSGGPLVQHSLVAMLEFVRQGRLTLPTLVQKMAHNPAILFRVADRGFVREGYWADLVAVTDRKWEVGKNNLLYKCGWSPFEGQVFQSAVSHCWVNGELAWQQGKHDLGIRGKRLKFLNS